MVKDGDELAVAEEDYLGLTEAQRRVFFVLAFTGEGIYLEPGSLGLLCGRASGWDDAAEFLRKWPKFRLNAEQESFGGRLTPECARAMAVEAFARRWHDVATETIVKRRDVLKKSQSNTGKARPGAAVVAAWALKMMAVAPGETDKNQALSDLDGTPTSEPLGAMVAQWLGRHLTESPKFGEGLQTEFFAHGMTEWLGIAFMKGLDARPALESVSRCVRSGRPMPDRLWINYMATCMWTGRPDLLAELKGVKLPGKTGLFLMGCQDMLHGFSHDAWGRFDGTGLFGKKHGGGLDEIRLLPARALLHLALMLSKRTKGRAKELWDVEFEPYYFPWWSGLCADYIADGYLVFESWRRFWPKAKNGTGEFLSKFKAGEMLVPQALLAAWEHHMLTTPRKRFAKALAAVAAEMERIAAAGYAGLASLVRSLLSGVEKANAAAWIGEAAKSAGVEFLPFKDPEPEWKTLLAGLESRLLLKQTAKKTDAGRLCWVVSVEECGDGTVAVKDVLPAKKIGARVDLYGWPKPMEWVTVHGGGLKDCGLWRALKTWHETYWDGGDAKTGVLHALCGMDNLLVVVNGQGLLSNSDSSTGIGGSCVDLSMKYDRLPLKVVRGEDGSYVFSLPKWAEKFLGGGKSVLVRKTGDAELTVYSPNAVERGIAGFVRDNATRGKFRLPPEAGERAEAVVAAIEKRMGRTKPERNDGENLPRVKSEGRLSLRLSYADGELALEAVLKPLPKRPDFVLRAATGEAETHVEGAKGPYLLERNAAEELADAERISAVLPEGSESGDGAWKVSGVAEALEALSGLKELDPPVEMEWRESAGLKVSHVPKSGVALTASKTAAEWFSVSGTFTLDDGRAIGIAEMLSAMAVRNGNYVKLSEGDWVKLTAGMAKELEALSAAGRRTSAYELTVARAALPMLEREMGRREDGMGMPAALEAGAKEIKKALAAKHQVPDGVTAELRPYQKDGYAWLARLSECGLGVCLADDMGLGKTLQVIALLVKRADNGASLVLAPASVCANWAAEIRKFAPGLKPVMALDLEDGALARLGAGEVAIASYGYLLFHEDEMSGREWNVLALDEAQAVKNAASKRAKAVKRLRAGCRVAATGTPVENNLGELWSLFDFLNPGLLGSAATFAARFMENGRPGTSLKKLVRPFILRRLKGDVLKELPERTEVTIPVELGMTERSAYEGCRLHALETLANAGDGPKARFSILAELTRLRRFCCHPSLALGVDSQVPSAKMEAVVDLLESLHQAGHKALVFSQFTDYLQLVERTVKSHGWTSLYLDGSTPVKAREKLVKRFQDGEAEFFLISLKAGGTGLNLTEANYVLLLDPWWNPAVENQAADRAHRIGQKNPVTVYRLVAKGTVEEKVTELHAEKKSLAADVLDGTGSSALSPKELLGLFGAK